MYIHVPRSPSHSLARSLTHSLTHSPTQASRASKPSNLIQYVSAAIRVLKHLELTEPLNLYNTWIRAFTKQMETTTPRTWEELSKRNQWLHWEEVLVVLRKQREEFETADRPLATAREALKYAVLLFYCCLPPGRAQEYRTLRYKLCSDEELHPTVSTPSDPSTNILFLGVSGTRAVLYLGAFKTARTMGPQKIDLSEVSTVVRHMTQYIHRHRPRLMKIAGVDETEHDYLFVVSNFSSPLSHSLTHSLTHTCMHTSTPHLTSPHRRLSPESAWTVL